VVGIDISEANIEIARRTAADNPYKDGFGSLAYHVQPFHEAQGEYDVVLFSVSLHHKPDVEGVVKRAKELVRPGGHLLCCEPCHERFREQDAAQVALIRGLLALTGHWYDEKDVVPHIGDRSALSDYVSGVRTEYVLERDPSEPQGQSPHDLEADGETMLAALRASFDEVIYRPGFSFIYRLLGGIRGPEPVVRALADFLALYDRQAVERYELAPNFFYFLGQRLR
jgi:SAM-dependent methyltransferase